MTSTDRPWPPLDIDKRKPGVTLVAKGARFYRFYWRRHEPIFFDRSHEGRLNAPDASYGVLYAARRRAGAFAETFLRQPGRTLLPFDLVASKAPVHLAASRNLRLAVLHGPGLAKLGATAEVTSGGLPYKLPKAWSAALHAHPSTFDGIAYRARHDNDEICYALFDRSAPVIIE